MDLTDAMEVKASEDIFDARGNKLLAKGAKVSRALQEKLIVHKLIKPLEACIVVEGGVDSDTVLKAAGRIADSSGPVAHILGATRANGPSALTILANLKFGSAMSMMLTIADKGGERALDHAITVSLLSIGIARKAGLTELEQRVAGMAGLLHDVGELYIDPAYLVRGKRLLPHEWSHLVVHPHTGQMLLNELESFPAGVGRAVAEHHERFDGSGYPRRAAGAAISAAGQVVSIAEMIAGVVARDKPLERAALALKIIPGEHSRPLLAAVSSALRDEGGSATSASTMVQGYPAEDLQRLVCRIRLALARSEAMLARSEGLSQKARELILATLSRVRNVQRAIISTGLDIYLAVDSAAFSTDDEVLLFEKEVATREMQWRLRDIARDLALQGSDPRDRLLFIPLVSVLDDDFSSTNYQAERTTDEEMAGEPA